MAKATAATTKVRATRPPVLENEARKAVIMLDVQPLIRTFNDHTPPAVRHLTEAAKILAVAEPDIFRLAYRFYYERDLPEGLLDELFGGYLKRQELPGWVRTYCNRIVSLADVGQLVPHDFGVETADVSRKLDQQFASWITLIGFVIYLLFLN